MPLESCPDGTIISLHITTGAKKAGFSGLYGKKLKLKVQAPPDKGRANDEIREFLSDFFNLPLRDVLILKGEKSRSKTVLLRGLSKERVSARTGIHLNNSKSG